MSKQLTTKEKLIQFLIAKFNREDNNTNEINISRTDIESIGISESDASKTIQLLETSNYIIIKRKSVHNDFSMFWTVVVNDLCTEYFDTKNQDKIENRRKTFEEFRAWTTLLISLLAFGLSIYALYLQYLPVE